MSPDILHCALVFCMLSIPKNKKENNLLFSELLANSVTMKRLTPNPRHWSWHKDLEFPKSIPVWLIVILSPKSVCPKSSYNPEITAPKINFNMIVKINIPITGSSTAPFFKVWSRYFISFWASWFQLSPSKFFSLTHPHSLDMIWRLFDAVFTLTICFPNRALSLLISSTYSFFFLTKWTFPSKFVYKNYLLMCFDIFSK